MSKLYHKLVYWPKDKLAPLHGKIFKLVYSQHAQQACRNDRYGFIIPPVQIQLDASLVFEMELDPNGLIKKLVMRKMYDNRFDISFAFIPEENGIGFVKTIWKNDRTDRHFTLNRAVYSLD
jgi:hypothetical protein